MKMKILVCSFITSAAILTCNSHAKDSMEVATAVIAEINHGPDVNITKTDTYETFREKMLSLYPQNIQHSQVEYYLFDWQTNDYVLADKPINKNNFEEPKIGARDLILNSPDHFSIVAEYNDTEATLRAKPQK